MVSVHDNVTYAYISPPWITMSRRIMRKARCAANTSSKLPPNFNINLQQSVFCTYASNQWQSAFWAHTRRICCLLTRLICRYRICTSIHFISIIYIDKYQRASERRTTSEKRTKLKFPKCPFLGGSTVCYVSYLRLIIIQTFDVSARQLSLIVGQISRT